MYACSTLQEISHVSNVEKIKQLERELATEGIDTLLILSREDSDKVLPLLLPVHVVAQTAFFFNRNGRHIVLTGSTDANMYKPFGLFEIIEVVEDFETDFLATFNRINPRSVALNISETDYLADGLTLGQYRLLESIIGGERLAALEKSSEPIVRTLRAIKSEQELTCIRHAVDVTCTIYEEIAPNIRIGMSETDIGALFVEGMKRHNVINAFAEPYSYPLVCINRCGLAHRQPSSRNILMEGDILICDFSVSHQGYCSDIARSFYALGKGESQAPQPILRAFQTTVNAVSAVIEGLKPGLMGYEADLLGRSLIEQAGYPTIRHSVGHQVGMRVHDGGTSLSPSSNPNSHYAIQKGEVYAIEPTVIQDDGKPSFIVEEDVLITDDGVQILSRRQMDLWYIAR